MTGRAPDLHIPVMGREMADQMAPRADGVYVDGTFGAGGYTRLILQTAPGVHITCVDRDPEAGARFEALPDSVRKTCTFVDGAFSDLEHEFTQRGMKPVDGIVFDLGVSSPQLDDGARGFSFRFDGPLDMRMDPRKGESAADLVNHLSEREIADILFTYGEERQSRKIAARIAEARQTKKIETTQDLAALVRAVVRKSSRDTSDPATRTFQALRIAVNHEMDELKAALMFALKWLAAGGRLVVVTFHSLEDRIVKQFFKTFAGQAGGTSRHVPESKARDPLFTLPHPRGLTPSDDEVARNPRARSARLRVAVRTDAPLWPDIERMFA